MKQNSRCFVLYIDCDKFLLSLDLFITKTTSCWKTELFL